MYVCNLLFQCYHTGLSPQQKLPQISLSSGIWFSRKISGIRYLLNAVHKTTWVLVCLTIFHRSSLFIYHNIFRKISFARAKNWLVNFKWHWEKTPHLFPCSSNCGTTTTTTVAHDCKLCEE